MQRQIHPFRLAVAFVMAFLLSACANLQKPVSPEDYLQSAKAQVGAAYKTVGDLKASGSLTAAEAASYFTRVEAVESRVRTAETVMRSGGDITTSQGQLQLALTALLTIQSELQARSKK